MVDPTEIETLLKLLLIEKRIAQPTVLRILSILGVKTKGRYIGITEEAALACFEGHPFEERVLKAAIDNGALKLEEDELHSWLSRFFGGQFV